MVKKKVGIPQDEQRLIYGGKQMEDDKCLSDYPTLEHGATVFLVLRLPGGATGEELVDVERSIPSGVGKTYESCLICLESPAMLMPCNHTMHPHCLMDYAWNEVSSNAKSQIQCFMCSAEWSVPILKRYGRATMYELRLLEEGLSRNVITSDQTVSECPGCNSFSERMDKKKARVLCRICRKQGKNGWYCWHCKKPWANSASDNECGNPTCKAGSIISQIQNAPLTEVVGVKCPSIRLCPSCGTGIEHITGCKQMVCKTCKMNFCFICLRMKREGSWQCGSYNDKCQPAPVQTTVPKK